MTSLISANNQGFLHHSPPGAADDQKTLAGAATQTLLDTLFEAALLCRNGKIHYANSAAGAAFDMPTEALAGKCLADYLVMEEGSKEKPAPISCPGEVQERAAMLLRQGIYPVKVAVRRVAHSTPDGGDLPQEQVLLIGERRETVPNVAACSLIEQLPWPVMRLDADLKYLQGNAALAHKLAPFVRLSEGEPLRGRGWPSAFCRELQDSLHEVAKNPSKRTVPLSWQRDRQQYRFIAELIPEHDPHGSLRSLLVAIRDDVSCKGEDDAVSSRLRHVQEAHEHVLAESQARDAFFGWVSHELRTPLNGIQSWAHILETCIGTSSESPLVARALHGIRTGISQQLRLIEELVDVSRVIQGKLPLTRHTFALCPVARSAAESLFASALSRRVNLACRYTAEDTHIESDPCRVQQALHLLLSHALEASPRYGMVGFSVLRRRRHVAIRIVHVCEKAANHAPHPTGNMPAAHKDSRKQMNLLLARSLTEHLGGTMTTRLSRKEDKMSHTVLLPLSMHAERQKE